jgi:hypothetical protein
VRNLLALAAGVAATLLVYVALLPHAAAGPAAPTSLAGCVRVATTALREGRTIPVDSPTAVACRALAAHWNAGR